MIKCLHDKMKWCEWHRHSDVVLGYYSPSDNTSGGASSGPHQDWLLVIETTESETSGKEGLLCLLNFVNVFHCWLMEPDLLGGPGCTVWQIWALVTSHFCGLHSSHLWRQRLGAMAWSLGCLWSIPTCKSYESEINILPLFEILPSFGLCPAPTTPMFSFVFKVSQQMVSFLVSFTHPLT